MSKIQEALKRIRQDAPARPESPSGADAPRKRPRTHSIDQSLRKKKVQIDGEKHHIDEDELIARGLLAPMGSEIPVADQFRRIKRPILENAARTGKGAARNQNVIMVTSALPNAGKTFCSTNLAVSVSMERELNVLLADVDVAKMHISREFGLAEKAGLIDLLLDNEHDVADMLIRTDLNDIQVLPAGRKHNQATELLASDRMSDLIDEISSRYADRIIIMDSPPLLITSEAQALADKVGQIVLVVESGQTSHQSLMETVDLLDPDMAVNIILNKSRHSMQSSYYGGGYGYYGY